MKKFAVILFAALTLTLAASSAVQAGLSAGPGPDFDRCLIHPETCQPNDDPNPVAPPRVPPGVETKGEPGPDFDRCLIHPETCQPYDAPKVAGGPFPPVPPGTDVGDDDQK